MLSDNTYISKLRCPAINVIHDWPAGCDPGPHLQNRVIQMGLFVKH